MVFAGNTTTVSCLDCGFVFPISNVLFPTSHGPSDRIMNENLENFFDAISEFGENHENDELIILGSMTRKAENLRPSREFRRAEAENFSVLAGFGVVEAGNLARQCMLQPKIWQFFFSLELRRRKSCRLVIFLDPRSRKSSLRVRHKV